MFYSHTFLARKGPLGTVWCAAHLQHKLKKSHYTSTDIPSTVDRIMFPEVPIALRMSGHLLLGVVRIYSKKVDYLYQDCNVALIAIKTFASLEVNLPEDANHAPFHSVTLPDTFELDALDLEDHLYLDGAKDNHLSSLEEITLTDQIPCERDPYVAISFDEDVMMDVSRPQDGLETEARIEIEQCPPETEVRQMEEEYRPPETGVRPMEEDVISPVPLDDLVGFRDPAPSSVREQLNERQKEDDFTHNLPEIEIMCEAVHNFPSENIPLFPNDRTNELAEPNKPIDEIITGKEIPSPTEEELAVSRQQSMPCQQPLEPPEVVPELFDSRISFGHVSPELAIRATPPVEKKPNAKTRRRKRKQLFDHSTVLTNQFMKKALEHSSDIKRQRKRPPSSPLGIWKFNNSTRTEQILFEPSISGICDDLHNMFDKEFILTKSLLVSTEESLPEPRVSQSPARISNSELEIERLRSYDGHNITSSTSILPEIVMPPSAIRLMPSPSPRKEAGHTPPSANTLGSEPEIQVGPTVLPMMDMAASTEPPFELEMETPVTFIERLGVENAGLSAIPELMKSAEAEDLNFLEADNNSPTGSQGTREVDALSVRTRAVAQYLKRQSMATPVSEEVSGDLSMKKILEGKTRKLCARMFFETLVLKSYGLVDVQQEEPYSDITLKLTPTLSKAQF